MKDSSKLNRNLFLLIIFNKLLLIINYKLLEYYWNLDIYANFNVICDVNDISSLLSFAITCTVIMYPSLIVSFSSIMFLSPYRITHRKHMTYLFLSGIILLQHLFTNLYLFFNYEQNRSHCKLKDNPCAVFPYMICIIFICEIISALVFLLQKDLHKQYNDHLI